MLPVLLVVLCVVLRVVPHPPNFAPVGATAVFAGRTMRPVSALGVLVVSMALSDRLLGLLHGYAPWSAVTPFVYAGFGVQALLGRGLRSRNRGAVTAAGLGSVAFFVLSNLGVWIGTGMYPRTVSGLTACYVAALPFYGATLAGDLVWTGMLCTGYAHLAPRLEHRRGWVPIPLRELGSL